MRELEKELSRIKIERYMDEKGNGRKEGEREEERTTGEMEIVEERVKTVERKLERGEREKRKRNILVKGLRLAKEEKEMKEKVEKLMKEIGVEVRIKKRNIETGRQERGSMLIVEVENEKEKSEIMENKRKLRGREIWIEDDLTWKESRAKWMIMQLEERRQKEGKFG